MMGQSWKGKEESDRGGKKGIQKKTPELKLGREEKSKQINNEGFGKFAKRSEK